VYESIGYCIRKGSLYVQEKYRGRLAVSPGFLDVADHEGIPHSLTSEAAINTVVSVMVISPLDSKIDQTFEICDNKAPCFENGKEVAVDGRQTIAVRISYRHFESPQQVGLCKLGLLQQLRCLEAHLARDD
jgi:hypothetical protein